MAAPLSLAVCQTAVLYKQNEIVDKQNELISTQNRFVERQALLMSDQNHLVEASRRAGLIFELANILDDIRTEVERSELATEGAKHASAESASAGNAGRVARGLTLKDLVPPSLARPVWLDMTRSPGPYELSDRLVNRIVSLSRALRPYRYYEYGDDGAAQLRARPSSPERGQLLIALAESRVDDGLGPEPHQSAACQSTGHELRRHGPLQFQPDGCRPDRCQAGGVKLCGAYLREAILLNIEDTDRADFSGAEVDDIEGWLEFKAPALAERWKVMRHSNAPDDRRRMLVLKTEASPRKRPGDNVPRPCGTWVWKP